jgi:hypothetical protein
MLGGETLGRRTGRRGGLALVGLCVGCNLVFGTEGLETESDGSTGDATATAGTGEGAACVTTPIATFNTGAPEATVSALLAVDDDPAGSLIVAGTTTMELNLGGQCEALMPSETVGFVARFSVDGECLAAGTIGAPSGFTLLAADYNATLRSVAVGGLHGGDPYMAKGSIDELGALAEVDPFETNGLVRALDLRDDDTIVATGECFGIGVLVADGEDTNCVVYPETIMLASGVLEDAAGIFIAGSYSSSAEDPLPPAAIGDEGVFVARLTGADLALRPVEGLSGAFPLDNWYRTSVAFAGDGDGKLAVGAVSDGALKIVELDAATLDVTGDRTFAAGCDPLFASDLIATPGGWAIAGGARDNDSPGCRALGVWGDGDPLLELPFANPSAEGPRPRIAAGCFGIAAATASPSTLYLEYATP